MALSVDPHHSQKSHGFFLYFCIFQLVSFYYIIGPIAQSVSALNFNFDRAVEGSILSVGIKVESENLNVIIWTIN